MFKKITLMFLVGCLTTLSAQAVFAAEKVAIVSLQRALNEVKAGKTAKENLKRDFEKKKKELMTLKESLEKEGKELEKQKSVLSKEALQQKAQALQKRYFDIQNKEGEYIKQLKTQEGESAKTILTGLRELVLQMAQSQGYTMVYENSGNNIIYSKNGEDITDKLIAEYNAKKK